VHPHQALIEELENAVVERDIGERAAILRRVTDLFVGTSGQLSGEQIGLFDDVMSRLIEKIEISARAALGQTLATMPDAPPELIRKLALDDAIEVAGPVLAHSQRVDDPTLVESAKTKSQGHLLAISQRKVLTEPVTDVLVARGDREVALSTAGNPGAAFSEFGYSTLVHRSSGDRDLAMRVWTRREIPRPHLLKLFADATGTVKAELTRKDPHRAEMVSKVVAEASQQLHAGARAASADHAAAYADVQSLRAAGQLDEARLAEFARSGKFDETVIALSLICNMPIAAIEHALVDERLEPILLIAKSTGLTWDTLKAILVLQADAKGGSAPDLDIAFATFVRLKVETANKTIQFYRLSAQAASAHPD